MRGLYAGAIRNSAAVEALTSVLIAINRRHKVTGSGIRITGLPKTVASQRAASCVFCAARTPRSEREAGNKNTTRSRTNHAGRPPSVRLTSPTICWWISAQHENEPSMPRTPKVAIVGAGIGGLTAAVAMHRRGIEVGVYEQSPQIAEIGAGVSLSPNAIKAFRALGLDATHRGHRLRVGQPARPRLGQRRHPFQGLPQGRLPEGVRRALPVGASRRPGRGLAATIARQRNSPECALYRRRNRRQRRPRALCRRHGDRRRSHRRRRRHSFRRAAESVRPTMRRDLPGRCAGADWCRSMRFRPA